VAAWVARRHLPHDLHLVLHGQAAVLVVHVFDDFKHAAVLRQLREDELLPSFAAAAPEALEVRVSTLGF
jgi:hypothetical protein